MKKISPIDKASSYFNAEYNCVQSVFKALLEHKGLDFKDATYLASGFGGGIAHSGQQCGAVSGALLAIGLLMAQNTRDVNKHKSMTYDLSEQFISRFRKDFGKIRCNDLTGVDMSNKEAIEKASENGVFREICPKLVAGAVRIVMEMFPDP